LSSNEGGQVSLNYQESNQNRFSSREREQILCRSVLLCPLGMPANAVPIAAWFAGKPAPTGGTIDLSIAMKD